MEKPGMSQFALDRCRKMCIYDETDDGGYRKRIVVSDPRLGKTEVVNHVVRTAQDLSRVKRSYMSKYRIPPDNVKVMEEAYVHSK